MTRNYLVEEAEVNFDAFLEFFEARNVLLVQPLVLFGSFVRKFVGRIKNWGPCGKWLEIKDVVVDLEKLLSNRLELGVRHESSGKKSDGGKKKNLALS